MEETKTVQVEIDAEAHLQFEPGVVVGGAGGEIALEGKARAMLAAAAPGDDDDQEALGRKLLHSIQGVKRMRRSSRPRLGMRKLWRDF